MYLNEWGPIAWELFHYITYTYKESLKEYYIIFFNTLYSLIPCPYCSNDIKNVLTNNLNIPHYYIISKNDIIEWFIKIHNIVNKKLNHNDNYSLIDANKKYLINNDISIDHNRIIKFLKLAINIKGENKKIDSDHFFKRNIISLCNIYPVGINTYNEKLMCFINYKLPTNDNYRNWLETFCNIIIKNEIKEYNSVSEYIKYPLRDLTYNKSIGLYHLHLFSSPNNKIDYQGDKIFINDYPKNIKSNIIIYSLGKNRSSIIKEYTLYNNINLLKIYIIGIVFSKNNGIIKIKTSINNPNLHNKEREVYKHQSLHYSEILNKKKEVLIEYNNLNKDSIISIHLEFVNKQKNDKFIIEDLCLVGS